MAITPPQLKGPTELDSRPLQHAQLHAASAMPNTGLPSDRSSNAARMASNGSSPTSASQPKVAGERTASQEQPPASDRHQALRNLFRTRSHQTQNLSKSQHPDSTTEPRSAPPNPQTPTNPSASATTPSPEGATKLEEIDLRSPHDDPDYDIISPHEASHSSRNAQPDHASKYPKSSRPSSATSPQTSPSSSAAPTVRKAFESDDSGEEDESDGELGSWRSYNFV